MAKNSAAKYEVVAVDDEEGVQWWWWRRRQRLAALKTKARQWRGEDEQIEEAYHLFIHGDVRRP